MKLPKVNKVKLAFVLIGVLLAGSLVLVEVITYRETVSWLSDEFTRIIQEDNGFLAQSR